MRSRYCTIPALFNLRKWFEKRFGDLCIIHDEHYINRDVSKWEADWKMTSAMWHRGYKILSIIVFIFVWTIGLFYWYT